MSSISNTRIAKNTVLLYFRKILTIFIGLYASRLLLHKLGIDNYGLYGVAGSVVVMFAGLRALFSESIQRYINVEKGKGNTDRVRLIFTYGVLLNLAISIVFSICVEVGSLLIFPKLDISPDKLSLAYWILQFSLLSAVVSIMTTPYDAVMVANEKFNAYAYFSILNSILTLASVMSLSYLPGPSILTYAVLIFVAALIVRLLSAVYCKHKFHQEVKYQWKWDKSLLKQMTFFSGWNLCGTMGYSIFDEGINFVLNIFGGLAVNGARSVAIHIRQTIAQFNLEALAAFRPQTMRAYGNRELSKFRNLIQVSSKFSFMISLLLSFELAVFAPFILKVWLSEIPEYTVEFIRCIMLYMMIRGIHNALDLVFKSTARMKQYQIWESAVSVLSLPLVWLVLKLGAPYYSVFLMAGAFEIIKYIGDFIILERIIHYPVASYIKNVVFKCAVVGVMIIVVSFPLMNYFDNHESFINFMWGSTACMSVAMAMGWFIVLTGAERDGIKKMIMKRK